MSRNLSTRLLASVLIGLLILSIVQVETTRVGLRQVRDRAINDSTTALRTQTDEFLLALATAQAANTEQVLRSAQAANTILLDALQQPPPPPPGAPTPDPLQSSDGRRYRQGQTTTILGPEQDTPPRETEFLDQLLPSVLTISPDVVRISFITAEGSIQTTPPVVMANVPAAWSAAADPAFVLGAPAANPDRTARWSPPRTAFASTQTVISAIQPIYRDESFVGVLVADLSLERLNSFLVTNAQGERSGYPALLANTGALITAPEQGQRDLIGRTLLPNEDRTALDLATLNPALAPLLDQVRSGSPGITTLSLNGREHILATAPISTINWSLVRVVALENITASTEETTTGVRTIARHAQFTVFGISLVMVVAIGIMVALLLRRQLIRPLAALIQATRAIAAGELKAIKMPYNDEMGQLATAFNAMTDALAQSQAALLAQNQQLEETVDQRTRDLRLAATQAETALAAQATLLETLNRATSPIISVADRVLALPLIGQLNATRISFAQQELLAAIQAQRATTVILDLTGAPVIDEQAIDGLQEMISAARLLGAKAILVGVNPEAAQTMVAMGIDLAQITTAATMRSAIQQLNAHRS